MRLLGNMLRRWPWTCLVVAVGCVLGVGYGIGRQVWAQIHLGAGEAALALSLRIQDRIHLAEARQHFLSALAVWPDDGRLHFLMARTARRAGNLNEAEQHLRRAADLGWVKEAVDLEKALAAVQQGDFGQMEPMFVSFVRRDHPDKLYILEALVQGCRRVYQHPKALVYLEDWLTAQPDSVRALVWRGETLLLLGRNEEALPAFVRAVELDPLEDEARLKLVELLLFFHQPDEALPHLTALRERQPDNPEVLFRLAQCRVGRGEDTEASALLDRLLGLQPNHAGGLGERGKIALNAGQPKVAEEWLRQAVEAAPYEREVLHTFCRCLIRNGQVAEAAKCQARIDRIDEDRKRLKKLKTDILRSPQDAALRYEMGRILLDNGQDAQGMRWLQSALKIDPNHAPTRKALEEYARHKDNLRPKKD